MVNIKEIFWS